MDKYSDKAEDSARLVQLEELFLHLQRTVQDLDGVVLAQQKSLDAMERRIAQLTAHVETVSRAVAEPRDALDEKPPHY